MPHLLIAGTTGAGKSVGLNTMVLSLLFRQTPDQVRLFMVDPKMTELAIYEDVPHLLLPVVTDPQKAARSLQCAVDEMERRTQILADTGSKDLKSYNAKVDKLVAEGRTFEEADAPPPKKLLVVDVSAGETEEEAEAKLELELGPGGESPADEADEQRPPPRKLPYIVVIIDELADLMMTAPREVEISLARLAQKARELEEDDPVYDEALELVARMEEVSVSKLQREMRLGYNKAAKIIERMEREGIVGPANGVKPRQVLVRPAGEMSPVPNV